MAEDPAVTRFRDYLRIKSVHPNPDYGNIAVSYIAYIKLIALLQTLIGIVVFIPDSCIEFVRSQGLEIGLEFQTAKLPPPAETVAWVTWRGSDPNAKSIMLNSHMDVVPVDEVG